MMGAWLKPKNMMVVMTYMVFGKNLEEREVEEAIFEGPWLECASLIADIKARVPKQRLEIREKKEVTL